MRNDGRSEFQMIGMNTIETNTIFNWTRAHPTCLLLNLFWKEALPRKPSHSGT